MGREDVEGAEGSVGAGKDPGEWGRVWEGGGRGKGEDGGGGEAGEEVGWGAGYLRR
jgi:hypothetical protein